jgi:chorismate dehydratase
VWSFLYGRNHGKVEIILDNAPARSAELLAQDRVDAALVPVIAYQTIDDLRLIADVCVGAREKVRSVCLITNGGELKDIDSVSLDTSSLTSVVLTKLIFREFLDFEPAWLHAKPELDIMLSDRDCALLIGDPALRMANYEMQTANSDWQHATRDLRYFDLAELWHEHTGLGFVFAMWMTRGAKIAIDFASARDEGLTHLEEIIANYANDIGLGAKDMREYLSQNISYSIDESMRRGMELFFDLAAKNDLVRVNKPMCFVGD